MIFWLKKKNNKVFFDFRYLFRLGKTGKGGNEAADTDANPERGW